MGQRDEPIRLRGANLCASWSRLSRCAVLVLLVVVVGTQFAVTQHELSTVHAICSEHGALVDVDVASAKSASLPDDGAGLFVVIAAQQQNHHQHCVLVASRNKRNAFLLVKVALIHASTVSAFVPVQRLEAAYRSIAIYRSAPKHSPPIA